MGPQAVDLVLKIGLGGLTDQPAHGPHLFLPEAAGGNGGGAHPDAGGDEGLFRVVGDGVFIDSDIYLIQTVLHLLAGEMGRAQSDAIFIFDEPTIGLHPLDVATLLDVFQTLIDNGATVVVIEHDLDVIRSADYIIDMGPQGGSEGGRIVATGTPEEIKRAPQSRTGKYL